MVRCHFHTCTWGDIGRLSVQLDMRDRPFAVAQACCARTGIRPGLRAVNAPGRGALALAQKGLLSLA